MVSFQVVGIRRNSMSKYVLEGHCGNNQSEQDKNEQMKYLHTFSQELKLIP